MQFLMSRMSRMLRRRQMRRFIHQEVNLLAREAERFDCPAMRAEVSSMRRMLRGRDLGMAIG